MLLPACYSYAPLESEPPRAGDDVRVHVTEGAAHASSLTGEADGQDGPFVTGTVIGTRNDTLALSVQGGGAGHPSVGWSGFRDTLTLAGSDIRRIDRNRLDALRTTVLVGLGAGAVAAAVILVANANPGLGGGLGGGGTPRATLELPIRVPLGAP